MFTTDQLLRNICTMIRQPALLVDRDLLVVEANPACCEILGIERSDVQGAGVFELPDGRWNGPALRQIAVEQEVPAATVVSTPDIEWTLGPIGCRTVQVDVCRLTVEGEQQQPFWLLAIREQTDSRRRLAKHADMAKLLYRATSLASTSDSLRQILEFCVCAVCDLTGWPIGHAFLTPKHDHEPLVDIDLWKFPPHWDIRRLQQETESARFYDGVGLPGKVWQSGRIRWIEALADDPDGVRQESFGTLGIQAAIGIPIQVGGRVRVVLEFFNTRVTPQSPEIVMFCNHMAEPVGRVIERQETTKRLREAKEASERASQAKGQFLATMSHELRTPMTAVLGMLQLSLAEELPSAVRDYLRTAEDSAHGLLSLLNDILDFAGLESGKLTMVSEPFSLRELLANCVAPHAKLARTKGLKWCLSIDSDVPDSLVGDSVRLRQVIRHLLDNAVKFTDQGSVRVQVAADTSATANPVQLRFTVTDTGPGIAPDDQPLMLTDFTQLDSSFSRRHGGAGLGLALCRALVERLGGRFTVASQLGKSCKFQFNVPFLSQDGTDHRPSDTDPAGATDESAADRSPPALSVLLAEDTPANQKVISSILRKRRHSVSIAANGREALELVAKSRFDVILMDLQMPVMDGYQATAAIRELEQQTGQQTPIIALTAHSTEQDRDACLQAGMDAYLAKPIDLAELTSTVEATVQVETPALDSADTQPTGRETTAPAAQLATIDLAGTMKRLGGDEELFQQFIEVFLEDAPILLQQLQSATETADCQVVARAAHSLRGLAANFGATSVVELAGKIEATATQADLAEAKAQWQRLSDAVEQLACTLKQHRR